MTKVKVICVLCQPCNCNATLEYNPACFLMHVPNRAGADVNAEDKDKYTPLMLAAKYDRRLVVSFLAEAGANLDVAVPLGGATALTLAAS